MKYKDEILKILKPYNVPKRYKGYDYLLQAIELSYIARYELKLVGLTNRCIFETIVKKHDDTPKLVEENVNRCIEYTFCRAKNKFTANDRLTAANFIELMCSLLDDVLYRGNEYDG